MGEVIGKGEERRGKGRSKQFETTPKSVFHEEQHSSMPKSSEESP